jgi:inward rectifier potassium channel
MMKPRPTPAAPAVDGDGQLRFERRGLRPTPFADFYHLLMGATWRRLLALFALAYLALNSSFATLYFLGGPDTLLNARPGSFTDAFWFSVQTFATIGYGVLAPNTNYAHLLVTVESFTGMLSVALATGILFAKFSRPTARVLFTRNVLIHTRNGIPTLVFRVGNLRSAPLLDVHVKVHALMDEVTKEGQELRRAQPLELERTHMPMFLLAWNIFHPITQASPLYGIDVTNVGQRLVGVIVTFSGVDDTMVQTVHARHTYTPADLQFAMRFSDMMDRSVPGKLIVDYARFDELIPEAAQVTLESS